MAATPAQTILQGELVPATLTELYEVPTSLSRVMITNIYATNYSAGLENITIQIVPAAGSTGDRYIVINAQDIEANSDGQLMTPLIGQTLNVGDKIYAIASTVTTLTLSAMGTFFST